MPAPLPAMFRLALCKLMQLLTIHTASVVSLQCAFAGAREHCCCERVPVHHRHHPGCCPGRHLWLHHLVHLIGKAEEE